MLILQAIIFGLLIGGFIFFMAVFLQKRYSFVRRRLWTPLQPKSELLRAQMGEKPAFLNPDLIIKLEKQLDLGKDSAEPSNFKRLNQAGVYKEKAVSIFWN
jgi:hypothetical protein